MLQNRSKTVTKTKTWDQNATKQSQSFDMGPKCCKWGWLLGNGRNDVEMLGMELEIV